MEASASLKDIHRLAQAYAGQPKLLQASKRYAGFKYMQARPLRNTGFDRFTCRTTPFELIRTIPSLVPRTGQEIT